MPTSGRKRPHAAERTVTGEEEGLWQSAMRDVRRIARKAPPPDRGQPGPDAAAPAKPARTRSARSAKPTVLPAEQTQAPAPSEPSVLVGVDKRTRLRLKRGQIPAEAELDLHGHTQESAYRALVGFIEGSQAAGRRCVRVITGKGLRLSSGEVGVLRQMVPRWLAEPPLRDKVLATATAQPRDGGEGARYVLLRRKR